MTTPDAAPGRLRILSYAQQLTGVGSAVLARLLANELATVHDVALVEGGPSVPHPARATGPRTLSIPVVQRAADGRLVGEHGEPGDDVLARRAAALVGVVRELRPDAVVIDHYPFSKWELATEITAMIDAARDANPDVRVVASLRDLAPRSRYEAVSDAEYSERVTALLTQQFDAVLVHSDPAFARLDDFFPVRSLPVPLTYTGYVVEPVPKTLLTLPTLPTRDEPHAVLSTGGIDSPEFLTAAIDAFGAVAASGALGAMRLHAFAALGAGSDEMATLATAARAAPVEVHAFSGDFTAWLHTAALSISRGGYNTCAALLRSRVPAVVVPARGISDQRVRAARLAAAGLAIAVDEALDADVASLRAAIEAATRTARPDHALDLDGAANTRRVIEALAAPTSGVSRPSA